MNTMSIWHHVLHVYLVTLFKLYSGTYFQYLQIGVSRWPKFTNWRTYRNKWVAYRSLKHLSSPPVFSGILVVRCLVFCVVFCSSSSLFFVPFLSVIVFSVLLWFKASDYTFGIFKFFLNSVNQTLLAYWFPVLTFLQRDKHIVELCQYDRYRQTTC